jgi:predicted nucleic acid-binding protein
VNVSASSAVSIVLDASISLKWALPDEDFGTEAAALRDLVIARGGDFFAPSLWLYEVTSGLVVAVRRQRLAGAAGRQALANVLDIDVQLVEPDALEVYDDARRIGIGAHDAAYVTAARLLGLPLWTGDRRLYQTASQSAEFIQWIGDFKR